MSTLHMPAWDRISTPPMRQLCIIINEKQLTSDSRSLSAGWTKKKILEGPSRDFLSLLLGFDEGYLFAAQAGSQ